ncbi:MAG: tetratricopeptide repeat protein [Deltaproteobacteria bacterium]|nr:tetratricopeptide repeat protein [Deltaproteobacteria bacterium]
MLRGFSIFFLLLALAAVALEMHLRSQARAHARQMEMAAERALLRGGLPGLLRARALTLGWAAVARDAEAAATLALANALLASEYGLGETRTALTAADIVESTPRASPRAQALKLASRALVEVTLGHPERAEALARQSVALGHRQASPLFVLGRVRFRQGDPAAAATAFQAALVREPGLVEARVDWAEAWLELGEPARAREALLAALRRTPDHVRAHLLWAETEAASPGGGATAAAWETACARDAARSPFVASACALARARKAWQGRDWETAVRFAQSAGRYRPPEPRAFAGAAQLLASLGAVDRASPFVDEAVRGASPALPSIRWARLALDLGRGHLAELPAEVPVASSPWAPFMRARVALATGSTKALTEALSESEDGDADLAALAAAAKGHPAGVADDGRAALDPARAYVLGMRARLAGDLALAADLLARALHRHGAACRAAGEYLEVCRVLGRIPDASALAWLASENARCVNLPAAAAAAAEKRKPARRAAHGPR